MTPNCVLSPFSFATHVFLYLTHRQHVFCVYYSTKCSNLNVCFKASLLKLVTHVQTLTPRHEFLIIFLKQICLAIHVLFQKLVVWLIVQTSEIMLKRLFVLLRKGKKLCKCFFHKKSRYVSGLMLPTNDCKLLLFLLDNKSCSSNPFMEKSLVN